MSEKDIAERLRDAYTRTGGNSAGDPFVSQIAREIAAVASAIEARRAETGTGSVHESAVREAGTPITASGVPADERARIRNEALEEAKRAIEEQMHDFMAEVGIVDPETGTWEATQLQEEAVGQWSESIDAIEALKTKDA